MHVDHRSDIGASRLEAWFPLANVGMPQIGNIAKIAMSVHRLDYDAFKHVFRQGFGKSDDRTHGCLRLFFLAVIRDIPHRSILCTVSAVRPR